MKPYRFIFLYLGILVVILVAGVISLGGQLNGSSTALAASIQAYDVDIPILSYHKIDVDALSTWYVTADQFSKQMDVLQAYGYQAVSLKDYLDYSNGVTPPPHKPVIITFDDGYQGVYDYAYPILAARDMPATIYVLTGYTGETDQDRYSNAWNPSEPLTYHMIWPEVYELEEFGFSIGSHTVTHPNLLDLTEEEAMYEIFHSYDDIQAYVPDTVNISFAYPYGNGSDSPLIRDLVEQAGYTTAVAFGGDEGIANPAYSDIWALPRRTIYKEVSLELDNQDPWYFFMRRVDPDFPIPNIGTENFVVLDSAGYERTHYYPGESFTVTLDAYNWGSPTDVKATLELTNALSTLYNSHWMSPTEDVVVPQFAYHVDPVEFSYQVSLSDTVTLGEYAYTFNIYDNYYLLNYYKLLGQPAISVEESPVSIETNADSIELHGSEPFDLWFTINNTGSPATEMYLTVSLSPGLKIVSAYPADEWTYYPIGSNIKMKDCVVDCPTSTYFIGEAFEANYGIEKRAYRLTIQSVTGSSENEWVSYRLSMRFPDGQLTPDWYLRCPLNGEIDQQGWYARSLPVTVYRNDVFIPFISKQ